jgi:hypothetical protein
MSLAGQSQCRGGGYFTRSNDFLLSLLRLEEAWGGGLHQCFGSGFMEPGTGSSILGWIPIRIQGFDDRNWKKLNIFLSKISIYLHLGLYKGRPSFRRSIQPSKENSQHFKSWNFFCGPFLPSWIRICWPDRIRIQSGSGTLVSTLRLMVGLYRSPIPLGRGGGGGYFNP